MARGKTHSDETRAAVMAALLTGQGVSEIAAEYKLPESSVRNWKRQLSSEQLAEVSAKKGERLETLLFDYLTTVLSTLQKQAEIVGTEAYIRKQPADSLAVLHGVMADKAIRILEAAERGRQ
jgi:transposase-like protein